MKEDGEFWTIVIRYELIILSVMAWRHCRREMRRLWRKIHRRACLWSGRTPSLPTLTGCCLCTKKGYRVSTWKVYSSSLEPMETLFTIWKECSVRLTVFYLIQSLKLTLCSFPLLFAVHFAWILKKIPLFWTIRAPQAHHCPSLETSQCKSSFWLCQFSKD